jgi:hypothetical protein
MLKQLGLNVELLGYEQALSRLKGRAGRMGLHSGRSAVVTL